MLKTEDPCCICTPLQLPWLGSPFSQWGTLGFILSWQACLFLLYNHAECIYIHPCPPSHYPNYYKYYFNNINEFLINLSTFALHFSVSFVYTCIWIFMFSNIRHQVSYTSNWIFMISKFFDFHNFCEIDCKFQSLFLFPIFTTFVKCTIMIFIFSSKFHTTGEIDYHDFSFSFSNFHNFCEIVSHDFYFQFQISHFQWNRLSWFFIFISNFHIFCEIVHHDLYFPFQISHFQWNRLSWFFIFISNFHIPDEVAIIDFRNQF